MLLCCFVVLLCRCIVVLLCVWFVVVVCGLLFCLVVVFCCVGGLCVALLLLSC